VHPALCCSPAPISKNRAPTGGGPDGISWRHGGTGAGGKTHASAQAQLSLAWHAGSRDLAFSRRFYEEFLGLEVVQTSPISLLIRLGGPNTIAVVYSKNVEGMNLLNHNGLDVRTRGEVDEAHRIVCAQAEQWHLKKITKPHLQHGTYSFFFWDADDNCWEILTNPEGGYSWLFEQGDQQGKGHLDRNFKRPGVVS
jgi:catechol 2,3-dioxygenase-like lactoylglutathione lyase family enzyme